MKVESIAPLILDACINTLKERPLSTRYHPNKDHYVIDTRMMARVIWYNGELQAEVTQPQTHLCNMFIKNLIEQHLVSSVLTNNKYIIEENVNGSKKGMIVKKKKFLEKTAGRNPEFLTKGVVNDGRHISRN